MSLSALLRRTNRIEIDQDYNLLFKTYRNYPYTVIPQVALGLRSKVSLQGLYRAETEQRKVRFLEKAGFPLGEHYVDFMLRPDKPTVTVQYDQTFLNVEEKIKQEVSKEEAFTLVGKCASQLRELHHAGKSNGEIKMTHGDPYLENVRYYANGSVRWFDLEHQYTVLGTNAVAMDGAIFVGHALQVLRDCGHIKNKLDRADLRDAIEQHYPGLRTYAPQGKTYLRLRFGK